MLRGDGTLRTVELDPRTGRQLTSGGVFFNRAAGAAQLQSGVIAVANRGNNEILFFDSLGQSLGSAGRKGADPANSFRLRTWRTCVATQLSFLTFSCGGFLFTPRGFVRDYPVRAPERANPPPSLGELYSGFDNGQLLIWLQTIPRSEADIRR
jgi:hypothetical protein